MSAYLDNSATTKPCDECVSAVMNMLTDNFGNPSSLHNLGINAMKEIIRAFNVVKGITGENRSIADNITLAAFNKKCNEIKSGNLPVFYLLQ